MTLGGVTYPLPSPFLVMATQNPVEQEGTYPLPEAQLDRFLFKLLLDYPSELEELQMVQRWGSVTSHPELAVSVERRRVAPPATGGRSRPRRGVRAGDDVVKLVRATRDIASGSQKTLSYGASPRACLGLFQASKALAWLRDASYVTPALVQEVFPDVMRHRVGLTYEAESRGLTADRILRDILDQTAVPESASRSA